MTGYAYKRDLIKVQKELEKQKEAYEFEKKMSQQVDPGEIEISTVNRNNTDTTNVDINDLTNTRKISFIKD